MQQMMALGQFVFSLPTLAYNDFKRSSTWRHPSNSRVGARPARQSLGPGDDTITLAGVLAPEFKGDPRAIEQLRAMADKGNAYALVSGRGEVFGAWAIESVNETGTMHMDNGAPRRIEFDLQLVRVDDAQADATGGTPGTPGVPNTDDGWEWWL